jgi:hypothetical protein
MIHGFEAAAEERAAFCPEARPQSFDEAREFDTGLPREEFADVLFYNGFGARDFVFTGVAVLLDDVGEVVKVVDVNVVQVGSRGLDVAGQAQIHQQQGAVAASGHGPLKNVAGQDRLFGGHRSDDNVLRLERGLPFTPGDDFPAKLLSQAVCALLRTVHHKKMGDAAIAQLGNDLFADGARAKDQRAVLMQFAEDALCELDPGRGDRHGARAQIGFRAHALADFERALEQTIEHGARCAMLMRETVSLANLAEDFRLTQEHGIEASGDPEEVANRFAVIMMVERTV